MTPVHAQINAFYRQMEQAQTEEERTTIKQARQAYYDQLSDADQIEARSAAEPFLKKLITQLEHEADPLLKQLDEVLTRLEAQKTTAYTSESATRQ